MFLRFLGVVLALFIVVPSHAFDWELDQNPPEFILQLNKEDSERSVSSLFQRFQRLEQICFSGVDQTTLNAAGRVDVRMESLAEALMRHRQSAGLPVNEATKDFLSGITTVKNWVGRAVFLEKFRALSVEARCQQVELLLASSAARVGTLKPSIKIQGFDDFLCEDSNDPLYLQDLRRYNWEFRHLMAIEEDDLAGASDACLFQLKEAHLLYNFIQPNLEHSAQRWPLGRAFGMCARPMSSHYLDDEVVDESRSEPLGWQFFEETHDISWDLIHRIESGMNHSIDHP